MGALVQAIGVEQVSAVVIGTSPGKGWGIAATERELHLRGDFAYSARARHARNVGLIFGSALACGTSTSCSGTKALCCRFSRLTRASGRGWLRRQRKHLVTAAPAPAAAVLSSDRRVLGRQAVWAVPYLLFVLAVAIATPDFFGMGFACAVVAVALALEDRYLARWQQRTGVRLYRSRERGWCKRDKIYHVP